MEKFREKIHSGCQFSRNLGLSNPRKWNVFRGFTPEPTYVSNARFARSLLCPFQSKIDPPLPLKILATPLLRVAVVFNTSYYDNHSINMALIREKATHRAILLRKTVVLRYLFTSEVGWATKLTLIRKVFKYNGLWKLYERKLHFLHILQETVVLRLVGHSDIHFKLYIAGCRSFVGRHFVM